MNRILVIICFMMVSLYSFAQLEHRTSVSTSPTGGRFEIIQSPISRKLTFRLDKYTGDVYQYVLTKDNTPIWEKIRNTSIGLLLMNEKLDHIRFQLYMGGIALGDCFLLDIETGSIFLLYEISDGNGGFCFRYVKDSYVVDTEKKE